MKYNFRDTPGIQTRYNFRETCKNLQNTWTKFDSLSPHATVARGSETGDDLDRAFRGDISHFFSTALVDVAAGSESVGSTLTSPLLPSSSF